MIVSWREESIPVVFENDDFIIVDKPPGLSIQDEPDVGRSSNLCPGLISLLKVWLNVDTLHPVHRLDKVTSGLLIVAKHSFANQELSKMFANKQVKKVYLAVTRTKQGDKPKKKQGSILGDMAAARSGSWKLLRTRTNPSETRFYSLGLGERYRLCLIEPLTGKTHQIRVVMKSLSMPIVGDTRYGGQVADRTYLHAHRLTFSYLGKSFSFISRPDSCEGIGGEIDENALDDLDDSASELFQKYVNNARLDALYQKAKFASES